MKDETHLDYYQRISKVLLYIQKHLYEPLELEHLANLAYFSPFHFHRVFRGMVGESLAEYVRRLRLEHAAGKLIQTKHSVTDIAFDTGYEALESFIRAFKARFGITPHKYRKTKTPDSLNFGKKNYNDILKREGAIMLEVKIEKLEAQKVAFVRHVGPYNECEHAWGKLCSWAGPKGLLTSETKYLGLCYDDPEVTPKDKIRYDACITVGANVEPENYVDIQEVEAGEYAVTLHKGPFEKLAQTYAELFGKWLANSGREAKHAPSIELYLNDPKTTSPEKLEILIQIPLI